MRTPVNYTILHGKDIDELEKDVRDLLDKKVGWLPIGGVAFNPKENRFYQAVVIYDDIESVF